MNDRIRQVMAKAFAVSEDKITADSDQTNIETWDSYHHMQLIVFLEREFDIEIPDEKVGSMISYQSIKTVVDGCSKS